MIVTIYNYDDDSLRLDKSNHITQIAQYTGTVRDSVDVVNPEITVAGNVVNGNYCKIDSFTSDTTNGGYYHITEKTIVRDNVSQLKLKRDAPMSFLDGIKNSPCICSRNGKEGKYNSDFVDGRYKTLQNKYVETYAFPALDNSDVIIFAFIE